jgi:hypothetical protein
MKVSMNSTKTLSAIILAGAMALSPVGCGELEGYEDSAALEEPENAVEQAAKPKHYWGRILSSTDANYCLYATDPHNWVVMSNNCSRFLHRAQWIWHKRERCLESRAFKGHCLTEMVDYPILANRGSERFTMEYDKRQQQLKENTGESQKWCITMDWSGNPPYDLEYKPCSRFSQDQKFIPDVSIGF